MSTTPADSLTVAAAGESIALSGGPAALFREQLADRKTESRHKSPRPHSPADHELAASQRLFGAALREQHAENLKRRRASPRRDAQFARTRRAIAADRRRARGHYAKAATVGNHRPSSSAPRRARARHTPRSTHAPPSGDPGGGGPPEPVAPGALAPFLIAGRDRRIADSSRVVA